MGNVRLVDRHGRPCYLQRQVMKIHWICPYRIDKDLGRGTNDAVSVLKTEKEDWIGLTDYDTLFLLPETKKNIESIIRIGNYDVLGCLTNRIGAAEQRLGGYFNEDDRILYHMQLARNAWRDKGTQVLPASGPLAAFMLCFSMSAYQKCGGFIEGQLNFDSLFSQRARKSGLRLGIMQGIYVWHSYRLGSDNPRADYKHLVPERTIITDDLNR